MRFAPFAAVALLLASTSPAFAHKLYVDATPDGDRLRVEAYYDEDIPAPNARVSVRSGDQLIAEGRTDEMGVWTSPKLGPGTYMVTAQDVGHASDPDTVVIADPDAPPSLSAAPDPAPESQTRADKTRTPWRRIGLGIGLIAGFVLLSRLLRRSTTSASRAPD